MSHAGASADLVAGAARSRCSALVATGCDTGIDGLDDATGPVPPPSR